MYYRFDSRVTGPYIYIYLISNIQVQNTNCTIATDVNLCWRCSAHSWEWLVELLLQTSRKTGYNIFYQTLHIGFNPTFMDQNSSRLLNIAHRSLQINDHTDFFYNNMQRFKFIHFISVFSHILIIQSNTSKSFSSDLTWTEVVVGSFNSNINDSIMRGSFFSLIFI